MYYRGAAAAIVVYDITKMASFKTLQSWVEELRAHGPRDIIIAIAGNKSDLAYRREVDVTAAEAYAKSIGATYTETSAKDDRYVQTLFILISKYSIHIIIIIIIIVNIFAKIGERLPEQTARDANVLRPVTVQTEPQGKKSQCC